MPPGAKSKSLTLGGRRTLRGGACFFLQINPSGGSMFEGLFQPMHLLVIVGIALLIFGPRKLPELGKGIGEGIRGFKAALRVDTPEENKKS